jgi:hypothetical protein
LDNGKVFEVPHKYIQFTETKKLPDVDEQAIYVPKSQTYPAIDLLRKSEEYIIGVQVYTKSHYDVAALFETMCTEKGWTSHNLFKLYLLYLCPVTDVKLNKMDFSPIHENSQIKVFVCTIDEIEGFNTPPWFWWNIKK